MIHYGTDYRYPRDHTFCYSKEQHHFEKIIIDDLIFGEISRSAA